MSDVTPCLATDCDAILDRCQDVILAIAAVRMGITRGNAASIRVRISALADKASELARFCEALDAADYPPAPRLEGVK